MRHCEYIVLQVEQRLEDAANRRDDLTLHWARLPPLTLRTDTRRQRYVLFEDIRGGDGRSTRKDSEKGEGVFSASGLWPYGENL